MSRFQQIFANPHGRDFAVGDIHGHFSRLQAVLSAVGFDTSRDRLFSVGDLVDRGPESVQCLEWLAQPWFFVVQGNHEALAIQHVQGRIADYRLYMASGGAWFLDLPLPVQRSFAERFAQMPIALEVETAEGPVGLVHADCPLPSWAMLRDTLLGHLPGMEWAEEVCQWSRERQRSQDASGIPDLRAMVVGHTYLPNPDVLGNVFHIDTGGWRSDGRGRFSLLDLASLTFY